MYGSDADSDGDGGSGARDRWRGGDGESRARGRDCKWKWDDNGSEANAYCASFPSSERWELESSGGIWCGLRCCIERHCRDPVDLAIYPEMI